MIRNEIFELTILRFYARNKYIFRSFNTQIEQNFIIKYSVSFNAFLK